MQSFFNPSVNGQVSTDKHLTDYDVEYNNLYKDVSDLISRCYEECKILRKKQKNQERNCNYSVIPALKQKKTHAINSCEKVTKTLNELTANIKDAKEKINNILCYSKELDKLRFSDVFMLKFKARLKKICDPIRLKLNRNDFSTPSCE